MDNNTHLDSTNAVHLENVYIQVTIFHEHDLISFTLVDDNF